MRLRLTILTVCTVLLLLAAGFFRGGGRTVVPTINNQLSHHADSGPAIQTRATETGQTQRLTSADQTPEGLSKGDWSGIREAYEAGRRKVFELAPGAWTARNPHQQMAAEFDGRGAKLTTDDGTRLGLKLAGYGFSDKTTSVGVKARQVKTTGNRIAYEWDDRLTEWFVNDERGFEQGWTLASAPTDATMLRLDVAVTGGLRAKAADATTVKLADGTGAAALSYAGLKAWDATGKTLPARFDVENGNRIGVVVETAGAVYPVTVDPWVQQAYLKASNTETNDQFGISVAVSGDTVVVGAYLEDSAATGVNGNQADNLATDSGAAYVFVRSGGVWSQQAYLKASNTGAGDWFGLSVAVAGDTVVVGARLEDSAATGINGNQADNSLPQSGAAYVFVRSGTTWSQQAYLKASNTDAQDNFGWSVAVAGDTVVVGALFEDSAATGVDGNQADNSASSSGAAYVFVRSGGVWSQQAYLKASNTDMNDAFGVSVAVSGDTVVVGALFESSAATGVNGNQTDNSANAAGAAYVFIRSGGVWSQQAYLKASNTDAADRFGEKVAVAGDTVVVGAWLEDSAATGVNGNQADNSAGGAGAAYVFVRSGGVWSQQAYLKASNTGADDNFGWSVAVAGDTVVVGAVNEDSAATGVNGNQGDDSAIESGAAYVFVRSGGVWSQQMYLKASNTNATDQFGESVAVAGDTVVVGAYIEDSNATGVNGNQTDNSATDSGAVYTFVLGESVLAINRAGANPTCSSGTVAWTVTFSGPVAGLTAANFSFVPSGVTGATITGVTGGPTVWTVTATTGTGGGSLGLNLANASGVTPQIAILPFTGQVYTVAAPPTVMNPATATGTVGTAFSQTFTASGGTGPYTFNVQTGTLPMGLTLNPTTGVLSGTPTQTGTFPITVRTTDANGCQGTGATYNLVITCPTITVSPVTLPAANVGVAYSQTVTASGGVAPYTFAVTTGTLPAGLTLNPTTGTITGTATTVGNFTFTITATDANKCTGTRSYTIAVGGVELSLLYVADTDNSRIQVFDGTNWSLASRSSGVVGGAAGQFRSPEGVTATRTNQIYVADTGNNRIHWYNGFTWSDFLTIGSALNQVRAPQAVAIDVTGQFLFVADTGNNRVLRFNATAPGSAGVVLANSGGASGQVNNPRGLAIDNLGNLFIADTGNSRILRIANATTTAAADTGTVVTSALRVPEGVALDNEGNLYIADTGNSRILQLPGGVPGTPTALATLGTALGAVRSPEGVTVTNFAAGPLAGRTLLIGDTINNRIQARPLAGGAWSIVGGTGSGLGQFRSPSKVR